MTASSELENELNSVSMGVQQYVKELQAENGRLVKQVAKLEARLTTANSIIESYKTGKAPNPTDYLSDAELTEIINREKQTKL